MKKTFLITAVLVLFSSILFAKDFRFSLTPEYNLENGEAYEYVLYTDYEIESLLDWNIKNSSSLGLKTTAGIKFFDLSFYFAKVIPYKSGNMYDSDWVNLSDLSMKTDYSISDNTIEDGYKLSVEFSGHFAPVKWLLIKPYAGFSYNLLHFETSNTEGWYGDTKRTKRSQNVSWDDENAVHYEVGELASVSYYRNTLNLNLGLNLIFTILDRFSISAGFSTAPYTYVNSLDIHWNSAKTKSAGTMYNDRLSGYFKYITANSGFEYILSEHLSFGMTCSYNVLGFLNGYTYAKSVTANKKFSQTNSSYAGCSGSSVNASVYMTLNL